MLNLYKNKTGSFFMANDATGEIWTVKSSNPNTERDIRRVGFAPKDAELRVIQAMGYGELAAAWVDACSTVGVPARMVVQGRDRITQIAVRFELPVRKSHIALEKLASLELVKNLGKS